MIRITNVLCPTDFSPSAQAALPIACSLARDFRATLTLLHVRPVPETVVGEFGVLPFNPPESEETLNTRMQQCIPKDFSGVVECLIWEGNAVEAILTTATQQHCDLIVLGSHGRSGLSRLLVGSVAEAVLRKAQCPVLTIKPPSPEPADAPAGVGQAEPNLNADDLVTVCSVANPVEAGIVQNALKAERIACFVEGAQQAGIVGLLGIPINIQVRIGDFDRANKYIQTCEAHRH